MPAMDEVEEPIGVGQPILAEIRSRALHARERMGHAIHGMGGRGKQAPQWSRAYVQDRPGVRAKYGHEVVEDRRVGSPMLWVGVRKHDPSMRRRPAAVEGS